MSTDNIPKDPPKSNQLFDIILRKELDFLEWRAHRPPWRDFVATAGRQAIVCNSHSHLIPPLPNGVNVKDCDGYECSPTCPLFGVPILGAEYFARIEQEERDELEEERKFFERYR